MNTSFRHKSYERRSVHNSHNSSTLKLKPSKMTLKKKTKTLHKNTSILKVKSLKVRFQNISPNFYLNSVQVLSRFKKARTYKWSFITRLLIPFAKVLKKRKRNLNKTKPKSKKKRKVLTVFNSQPYIKFGYTSKKKPLTKIVFKQKFLRKNWV